MADPIHLRVFLSSPGDAAIERDLARALIKEALPVGEFQDKATFEAVSWDDPHASVPTPAHLTPQQAVDLGLPKPSASNIAVVVLWSRMGTPLPADYKKTNGEPYLSGTEWEYEDALAAAHANGRPTVLLYRRIEKPHTELMDPDFEEKREQYRRVEAFFSRFRNEDGSLGGGFATYDTPETFAKLLEQHVRATVRRLIEPAKELAAASAAPAFQSRIQAFLDEYLKSETGPVPFGGRDAELTRLDDWLADETAPSRFLITAPAGRGKSALIVRWIERLERTGRIADDGWKLVFVPISIRFGTNRQDVFCQALAERLAAIAGQMLETPAADKAAYYADKVRDLLSELADTDQRVLLVVDGLDEALRGEFDATIVPRVLAPTIRVLASARWLADDIDSSGWLKRLDWVSGVRSDSRALDTLDDDAIGDVLVKMGAPFDVVADDPLLVGRLAKLTQGEPLLLRFYAANLWGRASGTRITLEDLDALKPGFGAYFDRWLDLQQKAWRDAGEAVDQSSVDAVLAILAFALGPLEGKDLLDLAMRLPGAAPVFSPQGLLRPLQRFVIGDGSRGRGYVLSHPKIGEHLQTERFAAIASAIQDTFVAWGREIVAAVNRDPTRPDRIPSYVLQFYNRHLLLADASREDFVTLVQNGWRCAWEHYEGGQQGFASDVRIAWKHVRRGGALTELGTQFRCALTLSSIRSLGHNLPPELVIAAARKDVLSVRQGLHLAEFMGDPVARVRTLCALASESEQDAVQIIATALAVAKGARPLDSRVNALATVAPYLDDEKRVQAIRDALAAAEAVHIDAVRAYVLADLAPHLDAALLQDALLAADSIRDRDARASVVVAFAPQFGDAERVQAIHDALAIAKAIDNEHQRAHALADLAPHLDVSQLQEALAVAKAIREEDVRAEALATLAPHLAGAERSEAIGDALARFKATKYEHADPRALGAVAHVLDQSQLQDVLDGAISIRIGSDMADALGALAPHLDPNQLQDALAATEDLDAEAGRAAALGGLAPYLDTSQLQYALAAAKEIGDQIARVGALGALAGHLEDRQQPDAIQGAFAAANALNDEYDRANALSELASHLNGPQQLAAIYDAFAAARAIRDELTRVIALGSMASQLDATQRLEAMGEALACVRAIGKENERLIALEAVAPHIDPNQLQAALAVAEDFDNEVDRVRALVSLAPHLDAPQLREALAAAKDVDREFDRAYALAGLAAYLDRTQLQDALAAAEVMGEEDNRARALCALVPYLDASQRLERMRDALAAAKAIGEHSRAGALGALAPHLDVGQLQDALAAAKDIENGHHRASALGALASHLDETQLRNALAATKAISDEYTRASALAGLAPHLDAEQRSIALIELLRIADRLTRPKLLEAIGSFVPAIAELGGKEGIEGLHGGIRDTAAWYP